MPWRETRKQMGGWPSCFGLRDQNLWYKNPQKDQTHRTKTTATTAEKTPLKKRRTKRLLRNEVEVVEEEEEEDEPAMSVTGTLKPSSSELDLDRPNIEDYLPSGSSIQQEPHGKLRL